MSIQQARQQLQDSDPIKRAKATIDLVTLNDHGAITFIQPLLQDPDPSARGYAAWALGSLQDQESIPSIRTLLQDPDPFARGNAALGLSFLNDQSSIPCIRTLLRDRHPWVRGYAANALGRFNDRESIPCIRTLLHDRDPWARAWATWALGGFKDRESTDAIRRLRNDRDWFVQAHVEWSIARIQPEPELLLKHSRRSSDPLALRPYNKAVRLSFQPSNDTNRDDFLITLCQYLFSGESYRDLMWPLELARHAFFQSSYAPLIKSILIDAGQDPHAEIAIASISADLVSLASARRPFGLAPKMLLSNHLHRRFLGIVVRKTQENFLDHRRTARRGRKRTKRRDDYIYVNHVPHDEMEDFFRDAVNQSEKLINGLNLKDIVTLMRDNLPPDLFEAFIRTEFKDELQHDVAQRLGVTDRTIRNYVKRSRVILKRVLNRSMFGVD